MTCGGTLALLIPTRLRTPAAGRQTRWQWEGSRGMAVAALDCSSGSKRLELIELNRVHSQTQFSGSCQSITRGLLVRHTLRTVYL